MMRIFSPEMFARRKSLGEKNFLSGSRIVDGTNKCLAKRNRSRTGAKATKNRSRSGEELLQ